MSAQEVDKKVLRAIETFENKEYVRAIEQFQKIRKDNENEYLPLKYIARSYRKIYQYNEAEVFFTLVVNSENAEAEDFLYYGQTLRANGKLVAAREQFEKFGELSKNQTLTNLLLQSFDEVETWENEPKKFITKQGEGLNTRHSEYGFLAFKDKYYITSNREKNYTSPEVFKQDETPYTSIFEIDTALLLSNDASFESVVGRLNTDYFDGPMTINKAENKCVIMRIDNELRGKDFQNKMKLYEGEFVNGKWKNFKAFPFNSNEFSNGHPTYGKTENELYFISDREGGFGKFDIYFSEKVDGEWQEPINLGAAINSRNNEVFPYYNSNKIYFSSDGFSGYGGLDLLVSEYKDGWQAPKNMKSPINSSRDDFGIYYLTDSTGFYVSNRDGGKGNDDIYSFFESKKPVTVGVSGLLEYKNEAVEGTRILLVDANDSVIATKYTDSQGRFKFNNLPYDENVFLKIQTEDADLYDNARLYLTDEEGLKIKLIERFKNGSFVFKALPIDETKQLALEELAENNLVKVLNFQGKIYKSLPGDYQDEVMVYLVDDDGNVVDSVLTDQFGNFKFNKLGLDNEQNYFVQMDESDPELNIAFVNEGGRIYKLSNAVNGRFAAARENRINLNNGYTGVIAKLESNGRPMPFTKVSIYNEDNKLIATVLTNEFGEFQYNKLNLDAEYYFKLEEVVDETNLNVKAYMVDYEGKELYLIRRLRDGEFTFTALTMEEYKELQFIEEQLVPNLIGLNGQIYEALPGDFSNQLKVYLLDESGEIIDSTFTNDLGKFNFEKLSADRNYTFKIEGDNEYNLALINENDEIIEQALINEKGNFSYKKLTYQVATFQPLEMEDSDLLDDRLTQEINGQVFQKLPGDFSEGMEVYIYNENGDLVGTSYTDRNGRFSFKKLKPDENYYFRIEHHDEDFQLLTLDDSENVLEKTVKNNQGRFNYKQLKSDNHSFLVEDAVDHHQVLYFDQQKIELDEFTVYYRFDTVKLNTVSKKKLQEFARIVKDEGYKVEIHSYTDTRGDNLYNENLSRARTNEVMNYLIELGFKENDLIGNYYGELNPVVDCVTKKCDNDDHALNRRTVVKLRE